MAGLNNTAKNLMLDALGAVAVFASLHTADPGATGTSEVTGGTPAYARKALSWAAAATASKASSAGVVFDVPGGTTISYDGYWSLATGGVFYGGRPLLDVPGGTPTPQVFATQGTYTMASGNIVETLT